MKTPHLTLLLLLLPLLLPAQESRPAGTLSLSLAEAQRYAVEHNAAMLNASLEVQKAELSRWKTLASMLPQVKAGFDYQNMCGYTMNFGSGSMGGGMGTMWPDTVLVNGIPVAITVPASTAQTETSESSGGIAMNPSGTLSLTVSVAVTGAQIVGAMLQKVAMDMTDISRQQTEQTTRANVKNIYVSILAMEQTVGLLDSSLANLEQLAATSQASVDVGAAEQVDADKLQVQVATLKSSISSSRRSLQALRNSLLLQLGADVNSDLELTTPLDEVLSVDAATQLLAQGFDITRNYNYRLLEQNEQVAKHNVTMAWMDFTPTVSAYYQYSAKTYFGKDEGFNMTPPNMVGASISVPVFSSGARMAGVKSAKIDLQEAANSRKQAEDGLRVQYNQLSYDLASALETYDIQSRNLAVTQRVFDNIATKYQYGRASSLEVTNASSDIINAQSSYIQAVMSVVNAQIQLENLLNNE
ncbi:MAG: TolC family protein [Bacteroidales bacterium]|nr:TolC family protein [Bacteroidales bacterium]